jgi:hypothetical protein
MKNALGMKSTGFKLWKIAAVAGACMALAAFGGTTAAFAQSVPAGEGCQGPEMSRFDDCQRLEGSSLFGLESRFALRDHHSPIQGPHALYGDARLQF